MNERRLAPRVEESLGIAVNVMAEEGRAYRKAATIYHATHDVSSGGICFYNDHPLAPDTLLKVHVALSAPLTTVTRYGRVRWCHEVQGGQPYAIGVQFNEDANPEARVWSNFVEARLPGHAA